MVCRSEPGVSVLLVALVATGGTISNRAGVPMEQLLAELQGLKVSAEHTSDLLRATLYSIGDAVITTNVDGAVQMMNAVAEHLTGYTESEARGQDIERHSIS